MNTQSQAGYTLTVVDLSGIQGYVFGSNRLAENVGASALVEQATHHWPLQAVRETAGAANGGHNVTVDRHGDTALTADAPIEAGNVAEVVYTGGGNVVVLFAGIDLARDFAGRYSRRLLCEAPGLEAALVHLDIEWNGDFGLRAGLAAATSSLAKHKATRPRSVPQLGLGVTATCAATGLPAAGYDPQVEHRRFRTLSAETLAKLNEDHQRWSNRRLYALIPDFRDHGFDFWYDLDTTDPELASHGQGAYLAVVHIDGNEMGRRFLSVAQQSRDDRQAVRGLRALSTLVQESGQDVLKACGARLVRVWQEETDRLAGVVALPKPRTMPFRPLVYGGDDLTFICEGRLGLELAAHAVGHFEQATAARLEHDDAEELRTLLPPELQPMHACAGVAIVKAHHPFARAYALAEDLCGNAKDLVRRRRALYGDPAFSALDWHIADSPLDAQIVQIRQSDYRTQRGTLTMRPVRLHPYSHEWRSWPHLQRVVRDFLLGPDWRDRRNKVQELRGQLRAGPEAVQHFLSAYRLPPLPPLTAEAPALQTTGWDGDRCGYFDAVEALDHLALVYALSDADEEVYDA